jgi:predicted transposase YbfD/YdcC
VKSGKVTRKTIYAITELSSAEAAPKAIARIARSQWEIEAVHQVRDTVFTEDASKIRSGHGPANMATLRNFAISTLRTAGHRSIAAGPRHLSYQAHSRPLDLMGLP